jgi:hypothetical protein
MIIGEMAINRSIIFRSLANSHTTVDPAAIAQAISVEPWRPFVNPILLRFAPFVVNKDV